MHVRGACGTTQPGAIIGNLRLNHVLMYLFDFFKGLLSNRFSLGPSIVRQPWCNLL
jgi:hypothetical protein